MMKLSVLLVTYNHEKFIEQALDSILAQQVDFDFEIVIGEDFSTDKTREIVCEYNKRYPDRIKLLLSEHNIGAKQNFRRAYEACIGDNIAILDGDDYWSDPFKLWKQLRYLDENPNIAGCFTNAVVVDEWGRVVKKYYNEEPPREITTSDIVPFGVSPSGTICFRRKVLNDLPRWFEQHPFHCALDLLITTRGEYHYLPDVTAAYRIHGGGVWSMKSNTYQNISNLLYLKALRADKALMACHWQKIDEAIDYAFISILRNDFDERAYLKLLWHAVTLSSSRTVICSLFATHFRFILRRLKGYIRTRLRNSLS